MARARNIKPGFFLNEELSEVEPLGRILFQGLWCIADRRGRLQDRPKRIKAEVLPYDEADVDALLNDLTERGFLIRYDSGSQRYIQIVNFEKHQNPHKNEAESIIPPPEEIRAAPESHGASTVQQPNGHSTNRADSLLLVTDSSESKDSKAAPAADEQKPVRATSPQWVLLETCADLNGGAASDLSDPGKQLAVFSRLLKQHELDDITACMSWMVADEFWREKKFDAFDVERRMQKFILAGKPRPDSKRVQTAEDVYGNLEDNIRRWA